jgi:hypothetical protein
MCRELVKLFKTIKFFRQKLFHEVDLFIYDKTKHYRRFKLITFNKNMLVTSASSAIVLHFGQKLPSVTYPVFKKSRISQHEHSDEYMKVRPHRPDSKGNLISTILKEIEIESLLS